MLDYQRRTAYMEYDDLNIKRKKTMSSIILKNTCTVYGNNKESDLDDYPYKCHCGKQFKRYATLVRHEEFHEMVLDQHNKTGLKICLTKREQTRGAISPKIQSGGERKGRVASPEPRRIRSSSQSIHPTQGKEGEDGGSGFGGRVEVPNPISERRSSLRSSKSIDRGGVEDISRFRLRSGVTMLNTGVGEQRSKSLEVHRCNISNNNDSDKEDKNDEMDVKLKENDFDLNSKSTLNVSDGLSTDSPTCASAENVCATEVIDNLYKTQEDSDTADFSRSMLKGNSIIDTDSVNHGFAVDTTIPACQVDLHAIHAENLNPLQTMRENQDENSINSSESWKTNMESEILRNPEFQGESILSGDIPETKDSTIYRKHEVEGETLSTNLSNLMQMRLISNVNKSKMANVPCIIKIQNSGHSAATTRGIGVTNSQISSEINSKHEGHDLLQNALSSCGFGNEKHIPTIDFSTENFDMDIPVTSNYTSQPACVSTSSSSGTQSLNSLQPDNIVFKASNLNLLGIEEPQTAVAAVKTLRPDPCLMPTALSPQQAARMVIQVTPDELFQQRNTNFVELTPVPVSSVSSAAENLQSLPDTSITSLNVSPFQTISTMNPTVVGKISTEYKPATSQISKFFTLNSSKALVSSPNTAANTSDILSATSKPNIFLPTQLPIIRITAPTGATSLISYPQNLPRSLNPVNSIAQISLNNPTLNRNLTRIPITLNSQILEVIKRNLEIAKGKESQATMTPNIVSSGLSGVSNVSIINNTTNPAFVQMPLFNLNSQTIKLMDAKNIMENTVISTPPATVQNISQLGIRKRQLLLDANDVGGQLKAKIPASLDQDLSKGQQYIPTTTPQVFNSIKSEEILQFTMTSSPKTSLDDAVVSPDTTVSNDSSSQLFTFQEGFHLSPSELDSFTTTDTLNSISCTTSTGLRSFPCPFCPREFVSEKYLKMHESLHKEAASSDTTVRPLGPGMPSLPLTLAGKKIDLLEGESPIRRMKAANPGEAAHWTCKICEKTFAQNSNYKNHIRTHSNERPYVCEICSIGFKERYHLKKHMLFKHSNELKEECKFCGKRFKDSTAVRAHERTHSDKRPYACLRCDKTFKTSECLWHHENRSKTCGKSLDEANGVASTGPGGDGQRAQRSRRSKAGEKGGTSKQAGIVRLQPKVENEQQMIQDEQQSSDQKNKQLLLQIQQEIQKKQLENLMQQHLRQQQQHQQQQLDSMLLQGSPLNGQQQNFLQHGQQLQHSYMQQSDITYMQQLPAEELSIQSEFEITNEVQMPEQEIPMEISQMEMPVEIPVTSGNSQAPQGEYAYLTNVNRRPQFIARDLNRYQNEFLHGEEDPNMPVVKVESEMELLDYNLTAMSPCDSALEEYCETFDLDIDDDDNDDDDDDDELEDDEVQEVQTGMVRSVIAGTNYNNQLNEALSSYTTAVSSQQGMFSNLVLAGGQVGESARNFACNICYKRFKTGAGLDKHSLVHSDIRPYRCDICNVGFKLKVHLKKHNLYRHSNEYPCECGICGKRFKDTSAVRLHERIHSTVRPFRCHCGKSFKTRENLWGHKNRGPCEGRLGKTTPSNTSTVSTAAGSLAAEDLLKNIRVFQSDIGPIWGLPLVNNQNVSGVNTNTTLSSASGQPINEAGSAEGVVTLSQPTLSAMSQINDIKQKITLSQAGLPTNMTNMYVVKQPLQQMAQSSQPQIIHQNIPQQSSVQQQQKILLQKPIQYQTLLQAAQQQILQPKSPLLAPTIKLVSKPELPNTDQSLPQNKPEAVIIQQLQQLQQLAKLIKPEQLSLLSNTRQVLPVNSSTIDLAIPNSNNSLFSGIKLMPTVANSQAISFANNTTITSNSASRNFLAGLQTVNTSTNPTASTQNIWNLNSNTSTNSLGNISLAPSIMSENLASIGSAVTQQSCVNNIQQISPELFNYIKHLQAIASVASASTGSGLTGTSCQPIGSVPTAVVVPIKRDPSNPAHQSVSMDQGEMGALLPPFETLVPCHRPPSVAKNLYDNPQHMDCTSFSQAGSSCDVGDGSDNSFVSTSPGNNSVINSVVTNEELRNALSLIESEQQGGPQLKQLEQQLLSGQQLLDEQQRQLSGIQHLLY